MPSQRPPLWFSSALILTSGLCGAVFTAIVLSSAPNNPLSRVYSSELGNPAQQRQKGQPIVVQTAEVKTFPISQIVAAPGESAPLKEIQIRPLVVGPVEQVFVSEGQRVKKGQPLLQVQKATYENAVAAARNDLAIAKAAQTSLERIIPQQLQKLRFEATSTRETYEIAEAQFQQFKTLAEAGATSKLLLLDRQAILALNRNSYLAAEQNVGVAKSDFARQLESAKLEVRNKQVALQVAQRDLGRTTLYAPEDSLVTKLNVFAGNNIDLRFATALMTLAKDVVFKAYVDQTFINAIHLGDGAVVRLSAYPGATFAGKVIAINPTITTVAMPAGTGSSRQYTFAVWLSVKGLSMTPGLQGFAEFGKIRPTTIVPESAVTHLSNGEGMAMVVRSGRAQLVQVRFGLPHDNQREVLSGLRLGERVILSPSAIQPGDRVALRTPY
jgi:HlyD family secretion protein